MWTATKKLAPTGWTGLWLLLALSPARAQQTSGGEETEPPPSVTEGMAPEQEPAPPTSVEPSEPAPPEAAEPEPPAAEPPPPPPEPQEATAPSESATRPAPMIPPRPAEETAEPQEEDEEEEPPLVWHTSMLSRYELRDGYYEIVRRRGIHPFAYDGDYMAYRARFGFETKPLRLNDDLRAVVRFSPQSTGYWNVGGDTLQDAGLDLHEGYVQIMGEDWYLRSGRFEIIYGDHFVVGNVGWHWTSRTFDAIRFRKQLGAEGAWYDVFVTLVDEGRAAALDEATVQDTWFGGFYGSFGPLLQEGLALDGYLLFQFRPAWDTDGAVATDEDRFQELRLTFGARSKKKIGAFDYRTEVGVQAGFTGPGAMGGDNRSIFAFQGDLEVGYTLGPVRLGLEGFYASGDDPDTADTVEGWNMLYPTAHKWLGLMDILFVRTNIYGGVFHFKAKPTDALSLFLDAHYFARPHDGVDSGEARQAGTVAYEVDVGGKYVIAPGLHTRVGYSIYLPQRSYYGVNDPVHFFELELLFQR